MISLLLLSNNFYAVISYRRVQKKKGQRRIIVYDSVTRYGPQISCHPKGLKTQDLTRKLSQFHVYLNVTQAKRMISLLLFSNNFYPVIPTSSKEKEKATNYCI